MSIEQHVGGEEETRDESLVPLPSKKICIAFSRSTEVHNFTSIIFLWAPSGEKVANTLCCRLSLNRPRFRNTTWTRGRYGLKETNPQYHFTSPITHSLVCNGVAVGMNLSQVSKRCSHTRIIIIIITKQKVEERNRKKNSQSDPHTQPASHTNTPPN